MWNVATCSTNPENLKDWIARSCIEIGTEPYGTWAINQIQIPRTAAKLTAKENAVFEDPQCQHLALGISSFLKTFAKIQTLGLTADSLSRLGVESGNKVPWLTAKIVAGIKNAGVLNVLNDPKSTLDQLMMAA